MNFSQRYSLEYCIQFQTALQERHQQTEANLAEEQQDVQEHLTCKERLREPAWRKTVSKEPTSGLLQGAGERALHSREQEKTSIHWTKWFWLHLFTLRMQGWMEQMGWQGTGMGCPVSALGSSQPQNSERAEQAGLTSQLTPIWVHLISSNTNSMKDENLSSLGSCSLLSSRAHIPAKGFPVVKDIQNAHGFVSLPSPSPPLFSATWQSSRGMKGNPTNSSSFRHQVEE